MLNQITREAENENLRLVQELEQLDITPRNNRIRSIDLCDQFITYWDESFRMIEFNTSLALNGSSDPSIPREGFLGKSVTDYLPSISNNSEALKTLEVVHSRGGKYTIHDYKFDGYNLNTDIRCEITVSKVRNITVVIGKDLTGLLAYQDQVDHYLQQIQDIQNNNANMNSAIKVISQRLKSKEASACEGYNTSLDLVVNSIINAFDPVSVDPHQRELLDAIRLGSDMIIENPHFTGNYERNELTAREKEITGLVKMGKTTEKISRILCLSARTLDAHRASIRRKLGISGKDLSLFEYLNRDNTPV